MVAVSRVNVSVVELVIVAETKLGPMLPPAPVVIALTRRIDLAVLTEVIVAVALVPVRVVVPVWRLTTAMGPRLA